jgi:hypothetical protein
VEKFSRLLSRRMVRIDADSGERKRGRGEEGSRHGRGFGREAKRERGEEEGQGVLAWMRIREGGKEGEGDRRGERRGRGGPPALCRGGVPADSICLNLVLSVCATEHERQVVTRHRVSLGFSSYIRMGLWFDVWGRESLLCRLREEQERRNKAMAEERGQPVQSDCLGKTDRVNRAQHRLHMCARE